MSLRAVSVILYGILSLEDRHVDRITCSCSAVLGWPRRIVVHKVPARMQAPRGCVMWRSLLAGWIAGSARDEDTARRTGRSLHPLAARPTPACFKKTLESVNSSVMID
jgi:hypothetical protein